MRGIHPCASELKTIQPANDTMELTQKFVYIFLRNKFHFGYNSWQSSTKFQYILPLPIVALWYLHSISINIYEFGGIGLVRVRVATVKLAMPIRNRLRQSISRPLKTEIHSSHFLFDVLSSSTYSSKRLGENILHFQYTHESHVDRGRWCALWSGNPKKRILINSLKLSLTVRIEVKCRALRENLGQFIQFQFAIECWVFRECASSAHTPRH